MEPSHGELVPSSTQTEILESVNGVKRWFWRNRKPCRSFERRSFGLGLALALKTIMFSQFRLFAFALLAALCLVTNSHAAPKPQIVAWKVANEQLVVTIKDDMGSKQVVAEPAGMKVQFGDPQALIVGGGYAIVYQAPGVKGGGYEGENHAVKCFNINGYKKTLIDKPFRVNRIREVQATVGERRLYVVSMADGGAGIPRLYLVDLTEGELWQQSAARMTGARNGKLIVALYPQGEEAGYEGTKSIGTLYLDLDRLVSQKVYVE